MSRVFCFTVKPKPPLSSSPEVLDHEVAWGPGPSSASVGSREEALGPSLSTCCQPQEVIQAPRCESGKQSAVWPAPIPSTSLDNFSRHMVGLKWMLCCLSLPYHVKDEMFSLNCHSENLVSCPLILAVPLCLPLDSLKGLSRPLSQIIRLQPPLQQETETMGITSPAEQPLMARVARVSSKLFSWQGCCFLQLHHAHCPGPS